MNIENPNEVIAAATNGFNKVIGYASAKLGPTAEKAVVVIAKQVHIDLWSNLIIGLLGAIVCYFLFRLSFWACGKSKTVDTMGFDGYDLTRCVSAIAAFILVVVSIVCVSTFVYEAPTVLANPEYAIAEKVVNLVHKVNHGCN